MRQLLTTIIISLSLVVTGITAFASNTPSTSHNQEQSFTFAADDDKALGLVNLCDPNGTICITNANAYKDHETGRIYVTIGNSSKFYAQKSNDSRWDYMIRYNNQWYYFSF